MNENDLVVTILGASLIHAYTCLYTLSASYIPLVRWHTFKAFLYIYTLTNTSPVMWILLNEHQFQDGAGKERSENKCAPTFPLIYLPFHTELALGIVPNAFQFRHNKNSTAFLVPFGFFVTYTYILVFACVYTHSLPVEPHLISVFRCSRSARNFHIHVDNHLADIAGG